MSLYTVAFGRVRSSSAPPVPLGPSRSDIKWTLRAACDATEVGSRRRHGGTFYTPELGHSAQGRCHRSRLLRPSATHCCQNVPGRADMTKSGFETKLRNSKGSTSKPQALSSGSYRQVGICQIEMGTGIQGLPRQHGFVHEPTGTSYFTPFR